MLILHRSWSLMIRLLIKVFVYKQLRVLIDTNLKWDNHIDSICSKASSRLYVLTQLKRNGATVKDMVYFYETVIRSVLERMSSMAFKFDCWTMLRNWINTKTIVQGNLRFYSTLWKHMSWLFPYGTIQWSRICMQTFLLFH